MSKELTYFGKETLSDLVSLVTENTLRIINCEESEFSKRYERDKVMLLQALEEVERFMAKVSSISDGRENLIQFLGSLGAAAGRLEGALIRFISQSIVIGMHPDFDSNELEMASSLIQKGEEI